MEKTETPAGIFTINRYEVPKKYRCAAEQKIEYISETHIRITTMDQEISLEGHTLSPQIYQSCMNPDNITIYPLEIECIGEKVIFRDRYGEKEWKKGEALPEIREWYPHMKKAGCIPCRNCGRC